MSGDLVACGVIAGLGFVIYEMLESDKRGLSKLNGIPLDPFGLENQCKTYLADTAGPANQAAMASYNAAFANAGGVAATNSIDASGVVNPPLDAAGQAALNSAPTYWKVPYMPNTANLSVNDWEFNAGGTVTDLSTGQTYSLTTSNKSYPFIGTSADVISGTYGNNGIYTTGGCGLNVSKKYNHVIRADLLFNDNGFLGWGPTGAMMSGGWFSELPNQFPSLVKSWYAPGYKRPYEPGDSTDDDDDYSSTSE